MFPLHARRERRRQSHVLAQLEVRIDDGGVAFVPPRIVIPVRQISGRAQRVGGEPQVQVQRLGAGDGTSRCDENLPSVIAVGELLIRAPGRHAIDDARRPLDFKTMVPLGQSELDRPGDTTKNPRLEPIVRLSASEG